MRPPYRLRCPPLPAMPFSEALRLAVQAIWTSKLRSFFTLLGILVSVAFLVVVVAIIQGMNAYVSETLTASHDRHQHLPGAARADLDRPARRRAGPRDRQAPAGHGGGRRDRAPRPSPTRWPWRSSRAGPRPVGEVSYRDRNVDQRAGLRRHARRTRWCRTTPSSPARRSPSRTSASGGRSSALGHEIADKLFDEPADRRRQAGAARRARGAR